jgi:hypothetical protein
MVWNKNESLIYHFVLVQSLRSCFPHRAWAAILSGLTRTGGPASKASCSHDWQVNTACGGGGLNSSPCGPPHRTAGASSQHGAWCPYSQWSKKELSKKCNILLDLASSKVILYHMKNIISYAQSSPRQRGREWTRVEDQESRVIDSHFRAGYHKCRWHTRQEIYYCYICPLVIGGSRAGGN